MAGMPWEEKKYGDPGKYQFNPDATSQPGIMSSPIYQQFLQSVAANRAKTNAGTQAQLGNPGGPANDPYAAQRENSLMGQEAQSGHGGYLDQQRSLEEQNRLAMQKYLEDERKNELEDAQRGEFLDKAGRTAYGGGQAMLSFYTGGAAKGKKVKKNDMLDSGGYSGPDSGSPSASMDSGYNPGY